ncbi:MAG: helix-turn-helix domain-containing protein [Candidatus Pacearchaeota archaeon]
MTLKSDLIKKIKYHFGLNIYESKVWLALLSKSIATVGEIAEISGVPRSRVYDVLESLEKQGFAIAKLGKPIKYIAVKPAVVIEHLKNNILKNAEEKAKNLASIKETEEYRELELLHSKGIKPVQPEDLSSAIKGKQNIYAHMKELISNAEKEVTIVSNAESLRQEAYFLKPIFDKLKAQGKAIHIAVSDNPESKVNLSALSKELGVPIRKIKINAKFCIVDNSKLLVFVTPNADDEKELAVWINSPFFSRALTTFLLPIWHA